MEVTKIALSILSAESPAKEEAVISIPQEQIDQALEIANFVKDKATNLLSEVTSAIQDLNGEIKPSVLENKDNFKSILNRLKLIKRKISAI